MHLVSKKPLSRLHITLRSVVIEFEVALIKRIDEEDQIYTPLQVRKVAKSEVMWYLTCLKSAAHRENPLGHHISHHLELNNIS